MHRKSGFFIIAIIFLMAPMLVSGQNVYGLSWGVSVDDEFQYRVDYTGVHFTGDNVSLGDNLLITVDELPNLGFISYFETFPPVAVVNVTYVNGTPIGDHDQWSLIDHLFFICPVGNWSYYQYIFETVEVPDPAVNAYVNRGYSEDSITWSFTIDYRDAMTKLNNTYRFSKSDGVMVSATLYSISTNFRDDTILSIRTYQISRIDSTISLPILVSSAAIIVEVIVVIEIVRRYRGRKVVGD
ncbi:MAG: hypothetical protein ACFFF4_02370 [Candidatus Thorarchaeota archaeon]